MTVPFELMWCTKPCLRHVTGSHKTAVYVNLNDFVTRLISCLNKHIPYPRVLVIHGTSDLARLMILISCSTSMQTWTHNNVPHLLKGWSTLPMNIPFCN